MIDIFGMNWCYIVIDVSSYSHLLTIHFMVFFDHLFSLLYRRKFEKFFVELYVFFRSVFLLILSFFSEAVCALVSFY